MKLRVALSLLASCCASSLIAQTPSQTTTASSEPSTTISVTSSEVLLDLNVRDKHGRPVRSLKPSDVEVYEDGVRQEIKSFRYVSGRTGRQEEKGAAATPGQAQAHALPSTNLVCVVFHNVDAPSRPHAIEAVQEFLAGDFQANTYFGLFMLDDNLTSLYPFTVDRAGLSKATADSFRLRPLDFAGAADALVSADPTLFTIDVSVDPTTHQATSGVKVSGGNVANTVITGADVGTSIGSNLFRGERIAEKSDFSNLTGMRETDRIITMLDQLGSLPGHKTVLMVTTGLVTTGDPVRFQSIINRATKYGITIFPLDITGLTEASTAKASDLAVAQVASVSATQGQSAGSTTLGAMKQKSRQGDNINDAVRNSDTQASLRDLAEGSGGFLIANTNDYRKSFKHILDDMDARYEAIYRPTATTLDGRLRHITVKAVNSDLTIDSRPGYFAMPVMKGSDALTPYESLGLSVLNATPTPHAFDFRVSDFQFKPEGSSSQHVLAFELPGTALSASPNTERKTDHLHASLVSLVKDDKGQVVDKFAFDSPYDVPAANLATVRATAISLSHPLTLPPGHYTVETAALDREGHRYSVNKFAFDSPQAPQGVGLSSVVLVQRAEAAPGAADVSDPLLLRGHRIVPLLVGNVVPDSHPLVYFVVYPDKSNAEKPKLNVEFMVNGKATATQSVDLPAADASGAIPMVIKAATPKGDCELKVTAIQGSLSSTKSLSYKVTGS